MASTEHVSDLRADLERRQTALSAALTDQAVEAVVIASESNFTYLTGYRTGSWANKTFPLFLAFVPGERPTAVVGAGEVESIETDGGELDVVAYNRPRPASSLGHAELDFIPHAAAQLAERLRAVGVRRLGIEQSLPYGPRLAGSVVAGLVERLPGVELVDVSPLMSRFRRVKSAYEADRMRTSAAVLARAYELFTPRMRVGMSERELCRTFVAAASEAGADRVGYVGAIADTRRASLGGPTDRTWAAGDLLMFDACIEVEGYWADFCRIFGARRVTAEQEAAYAELVEVVHRARRTIAPGVPIADVARGMVAGPDGSLYGRCGHGIGLDYTEPPSMHVEEPALAEPGMTVCLEPNRTVPGVGNLTSEEEVLITADGPELLSPPFPDTMHVVG